MSAAKRSTAPAKSIPEQSWLLRGVRSLLTWYRYLFAFWGYAGFYHDADQQSPTDNATLQVHRHLWMADLTWTLTLIAAVGFWFGNWFTRELVLQSAGWGPYVLAAILWRLIDAFVNAADVSPFGAGAVRAGIRSPEKNQRLVLLNLMTLVEVIFWNASLTFYLSEWGVAEYDKPFRTPIIDMHPATPLADGMVHALQTSLSTITTVGYGTYAPSNLCAVLLAFLQTFTGLLLISMVAAAAISLTVAPAETPPATPPGTPPIAKSPTQLTDTVLEVIPKGLYAREWLPLVATPAIIWVLKYCLFG
ncbi:MAG TPA: hypothetical protein DDY91_06835 [Planctomycetaceae bacterium]|nr:hypothetical protein [Planctomycetaceae bacterium]